MPADSVYADGIQVITTPAANAEVFADGLMSLVRVDNTPPPTPGGDDGPQGRVLIQGIECVQGLDDVQGQEAVQGAPLVFLRRST